MSKKPALTTADSIRIFKIITYVVTGAGLLISVIAFTAILGYPLGFWIGLVFGLGLTTLTLLGLHFSLSRINRHLTQLVPSSANQTSTPIRPKQITYLTISLGILGIFQCALLTSCVIYSCINDTDRILIFFIVAGYAAFVGALSRTEPVRGKATMLLFSLSLVLVISVIGRVLHIW